MRGGGRASNDLRRTAIIALAFDMALGGLKLQKRRA
jgi:hypothetical protein